jgi:hypothetical protein
MDADDNALGCVVAGLAWLMRGFLALVLTSTGLVGVLIVRMRGRLYRQGVWGGFNRARLVNRVTFQSILVAILCLVWNEGVLFDRWQALGLLVLGVLLWVHAFSMDRRTRDTESENLDLGASLGHDGTAEE